MITTGPTLAWPGLAYVGYRGNSTCASLPSLPSQLPYHYLLAHTALHRAEQCPAVPRSVGHLSSLLPLQSYTDLNTYIHHSHSPACLPASCTTYYLSPQVQWAQLVALLDWSLEGWMPSDFSINKDLNLNQEQSALRMSKTQLRNMTEQLSCISYWTDSTEQIIILKNIQHMLVSV